MGDFATRYSDGLLAKRDIRPLLDELDIRYLIVGRDRALYAILEKSDDFRRVQSDTTHAIFKYEPAQ